MGNLFSSMVRGFGGQIGRTAANRMMYSTPQRASGKQWLIALLILTTSIFGIGWLYSEGMRERETKDIATSSVDSSKVILQSNVKSTLPKVETYNGHIIYTGPRGGKYYYSKSGRKVYI